MKFLRSYQRFSLLAAALLCLFTTAQGQDFWSEGIHFNLMDNNAAEVTYMDYDYYWGNFNVYDQYRGDIVIPSSVNAWVYPQYEEPYEVTVTVKAIGSFAFNNCNELTSVTLPNTIESIGFYAFLNCPALASITCMGTTPPVAYEDESCFDATTYETATLYVPAEALEAYKIAEVWRKFVNIKAIGSGEITPGDVDGDGAINIGDVTVLIDMILNGAAVEDCPSADVDGDGVLGIGDLVALIDMILGAA